MSARFGASRSTFCTLNFCHVCRLAHSVSTGEPRLIASRIYVHSRVLILPRKDRPILALGLEGSANKLGAGVMKHCPDGSSVVLSNIRHTYITPPGEGFQPRDTALHHREWILQVITDALSTACVSLAEVDCICYTKGDDNCGSTVLVRFPESGSPY
jgi:hypothetical protein